MAKDSTTSRVRCAWRIKSPFRFLHHTGKSAINALLSPPYAKQKGVPKVTSETDAITVLSVVNTFAFFLRVRSSSSHVLLVIPEQKFVPDEYYVWFFESSQWKTYAGAVLMVGLILGGVMFPLWAPIMRLGVYP
jgi:translocation protein SEC62